MMSYDVVVTAFGRYNELEQTLQSICNQTIAPNNILLIIDGYDSLIGQIGKKFDCRIYSLPHSGFPSIGRNFGRRLCTSNFIAFCDDDDVWEIDKMEKQINFFMYNDYVDILYTKAIYWDGYKEYGNVSNFSGNLGLFFLLIKNPCVFSSLVVRNNDLVMGFNESIKFKAWEDYYMVLESVILGARIHILNFQGVKYKVNTFNKISKKHDPNRDLVQFSIISKLLIMSNKKKYLFVFLPSVGLRFLRSCIFSYLK